MGIRTDDDHFSARNRSSRKRIRAWRLVIGDGMEGETCPTHLLIRILGEPTAALRRTRELEVESQPPAAHEQSIVGVLDPEPGADDFRIVLTFVGKLNPYSSTRDPWSTRAVGVARPCWRKGRASAGRKQGLALFKHQS
jgi:hypothetical protein